MSDARDLTQLLGGRWHGRYGVAACPVCQPERRRDQAALSIGAGRDGRLLLRCFKAGCDFGAILTAAGLRADGYSPPDPAVTARREAEARQAAEKRARQARALWIEARAIEGTPAEVYLRGRGIRLARWPETLRFHPAAWHGPTAKRHPALIALVEGGDACAVHRTFLRADGGGRAGLDGGDKLALGGIAGGAVRLSSGPGPLLVAEGIESALSAFLLHGDSGARTWAALSTSGMTGLRLPTDPGRLIVAPDGDKAGHAAALTLADRAARTGWAVSILTPPPRGDFNDVLTGKAVLA